MKYITIIVSLILINIVCFGQQQKCFVHTAKGQNTLSTPLEGVYLSLDGNYNSDRSDEKGIITLFFPDKRNGDPFRIKSIEKKGYVLTDKYWLRNDASLSSKVLLDIAMKSESQIRRECAEWSHRITSATNERWYKKEKSLNDSLDKQRITIEEYEKEIGALKRAKESFGQMISYMSEYCASIDFSKISANQEKVLGLLKEGDIEGADLIIDIDSISDEDKIAAINNTRKEIAVFRQRADALSDAVWHAEETLKRQIEAVVTSFCLKAQIASQKGDFGLAAEYYGKAADIDKGDVDRQIEAACAYLIYSENPELYTKYYNNAYHNRVTKEDEYKCLELEYLFNLIYGKYVLAGLNAISMIKLYLNPMDYIDYVVVEEVVDTVGVSMDKEFEIVTTQNSGTQEAIVDYVDTSSISYEVLSTEISDFKYIDYDEITFPNVSDSLNCSKALAYLSIACQAIGKVEEAWLFLGISHKLITNESNNEQIGLQFFGALATFITNGFYKEALELCNQATIPQDDAYTNEQNSWNSIINMFAALCRSKMGILNGNESEVVSKGLETYASIVSPYSFPFLQLKSGLVSIYIAEGLYSEALFTAESILDQVKMTTNNMPIFFNYGILNSKATCYYYLQEYDKALDIFLELQKILCTQEAIMEFGGENNDVFQALNYYNIAQNYKELADMEKAVAFHEKAFALRKKMYGDSNSKWIYDSYNSMIPLYISIHEYNRAHELSDEYILASINDAMYQGQANKLKYDILVGQGESMGLSKQLKKTIDKFLKDKELAFWDIQNDKRYFLIEYDRYKGLPQKIDQVLVLTPNNEICKLWDVPNISGGRLVLIPSSLNDIKEHSKVYRDWLKESKK